MTDTQVHDAPERAPDETAGEEHDVAKRPLWQRVAKWIGIVVGGVVVLVGALLLLVNTPFGRQFVADRLSNLTLASGLNVKIGRIDGSIYGEMVLHNVAVQDPEGTFASAERITLDWQPFALLSNHLDIDRLTSPEIRLERLPELIPSETPRDPDAPLLPNIDIDIDALSIGRLIVGEAVTGRRHVARLEGGAHIDDGRAQIRAEGATLAAPGMAGGDRLALILDAVPEANQLDLDVQLDAPAEGLVAGLVGIDQPLELSVRGDGSWEAWAGRLASTLGGQRFAMLNLAAQDGTFRIGGAVRPGLVLEGAVERLTAPQVNVAIVAAIDEMIADTRVQLRSDALSLAAAGKINLDRSRFEDFRVDGLLLTPGAIASNLVGQSVRATVALDGAFGTPVVDYKLQAGALGFGDTVVRQLYAEGQARVDAERILIPVRARAGRITGLDAVAGGPIADVALQGDIAITGDQILSDNLRIVSDRVNATAIVAADISEGRYTGALKGRINDYQIEGIGVVSVTTDAELYAAPGGGWGIRGQIAGRSQRIYSDGIRNFLGGNAVASLRLGFDPEGVITFDQLRLRAPEFRITSGSGRYAPGGALLLNADAYSEQYGPLAARVTGSLAQPEVLLRAPRPGLGVGLAGLTARVRGNGGAYAVEASGETDYGPFNADVLVRTGDTLAIDVRSARFAGMDIDGQIRQTPAGPFAGTLRFAGSGVQGRAELASQSGVQRAAITARANNARIPGVANLRVGRAIIDATVLLTETPQVTGDAQIANLSTGQLTIEAARVRVNYEGGSGTAQLVARGATGVPFSIAANARLAPDQWLVALRGSASGVAFRTDDPARILLTDDSYRLQPTRLVFDQGSARIAGRYGNGLVLQARLDELDLSVVNGFVPGLGIGGTATGSLDFAQPDPATFPRADARLEIDDFTRSSLSTVSEAVDITFVGKLLPDGGDARALIKRGTTTVGRVIATLRPLPPGAGPWRERLMAAPLSGGIRYNGPAGVLFSLAGLPDQTLRGPIGVAANFSGRVRAPELAGVVRANNLTYENETYGTRLTNMRLEGRFTDDQLVLNELRARAGEGSVTANGRISLAADEGFPLRVRAEFENATLARSDALAAEANGWVEVTNNADFALVRGELTIPEARYRIIRQGSAEVAELEGVRRRNGGDADQAYARNERQPVPEHEIRLNLVVNADNRLFVSGMGLESEWGARITVEGTATNPNIGGYAQVVQGTYSFAGRRFELNENTSRVDFVGDRLANPTLNISASTTAEGITAIIRVTGTAQQPDVAFTSSPTLPQDEVLARLLFGSSVTNLSATEAIQLAAALNSLRGTGGGLNPLGELRQAAGIDRLRILGADEVSGRETALAAGQYLTDDIYVEIITDARGFTATQLEIALTRALSLLSQTGSFGGSSVSLRYSKDY
ncbi:translocation/assembly module TamB domain-containing protein [Sphingosinithalassobacter sp. LHW66-3]|uniref:translocation/assembly module TamB domain-containing protein n=1 Tax=Sphingosinithalassobacter sp. LHW66-3 TaxID=3424718 RepID=UPI003D6A1A92